MTNTTPKFKTNLDTDLLKLIAAISMLFGHIGNAFFPESPIFVCVGRLAFPIFCYCMTVGLLHTHNIKRYLGRLALFAIISQPIFAISINPNAFFENPLTILENITLPNILFALVLNLLFMWGITQKKWYSIGIALLAFMALSSGNFDYGLTGIILMLIFYFCRNRPAVGAVLYSIYYLLLLQGNFCVPSVMLGGYAINSLVFSLLAAPLIFYSTHSGIKINKWFFYLFYPAHLAIIVLVKFMLMK